MAEQNAIATPGKGILAADESTGRPQPLSPLIPQTLSLSVPEKHSASNLSEFTSAGPTAAHLLSHLPSHPLTGTIGKRLASINVENNESNRTRS